MTISYKQLFSEEIPSTEVLVFEPLLGKYKNLRFVTLGIFFIVLLGAAIVSYLLIDEILPWMFYIFLCFWLLWVVFVFVSVHYGFPYKGFAIREQDVHYKTGWLYRNITSVPICRIQHIKVQQSVLAKFWGLAKLNIYTAGDSSNDLTIPGISFEKALQIKALLSEKIHANEEH